MFQSCARKATLVPKAIMHRGTIFTNTSEIRCLEPKAPRNKVWYASTGSFPESFTSTAPMASAMAMVRTAAQTSPALISVYFPCSSASFCFPIIRLPISSTDAPLGKMPIRRPS